MSKLYIVVEQGTIQEVYSNVNNLEVIIIDNDTTDEDQLAEVQELEEQCCKDIEYGVVEQVY